MTAVDTVVRPEATTSPETRRSWSKPLRLVGVVGVLCLWSLLTYTGLIDAKSLPSPTQVVSKFGDLWSNGYNNVSLLEHVLGSVRRALLGFGGAAIVGVPLGLALGYYRPLELVLSPVLSFLRPIPPIAYTPLVVLYFGIGDMSKVSMIFIGAFLYLLLSTQAGVRAVPESLIRVGRNAGLSEAGLFREVILPGAMPGILTGLRTSLSIAWALVMASELVSAQDGLGYMVSTAGLFFDIKTIFVGLILIGLIGLLFDSVIVYIQRRVLHWEGH